MNIKRITILSILFYFIISGIYAKGILQRPRKVFMLKTEHFDILFPKVSKDTANLLADNIDSLYEKARQEAGLQKDFRIMVIISPDCEVLSVSYTSSPFKRIIIYDSAPDEIDTCYEDILLGEVYRQTFIAVSGEYRSPSPGLLKNFIAPVSSVYLPFSFIEGFSYLTESDNGTTKNGHYNDGYFLQILSQAKLENKFPSYIQASVSYDIYPGDDLIIAASTGFTAYLMNAYGYEKYIELWNECGDLHPYLLTEIFHQVYGKYLGELWKEFEDSIPQPADLDYMNEMAEQTSVLFPQDSAGLYKHILLSPYGLVWYDDLRHEVDIYDTNKKNNFRQLLFFTYDVQRMTLSADGRYIVISYNDIKTESEFKKQMSWIYDLKNRKFLKSKYHLKEAAIITLSNGERAVAGISVESVNPEIRVYSLEEDSKKVKLLYSKRFDRNHIPSSIAYGANGKVGYLLSHNNQTSIYQLDIDTEQEKVWSISDSNGNPINISELRPVNTLATRNRNATEVDYIYTFQYVSEKENTFTRMGYIELSDQFEPDKIYLQEKDLYGGVYNPVIYGNKLYYCSKKLSYNQLCYLSVNLLEYSQGVLSSYETQVEQYEPESVLFSKKTLGDYTLSKYFPLKYAFPPYIIPFFPVRTISIDKGASKQPGLGVTLNTHADPFDNNKFTLSAAWSFLNLNYSTSINAPSKYEKMQLSEASDMEKDKTFALLYENTSTPVDIKAGGVFNFNMEGEYYLDFLVGTNWELPIGMNFGSFKFDVHNSTSFSTDYFVSDLNDIYPSMSNWPDINDAYGVSESNLSVIYTNIHQYGITPYEKLGLAFGPRLYTMYDFYILEQARKYREDAYKQIDETGMYEGVVTTKENIDLIYKEKLLYASQIIVGWYACLEIPRLLPLQVNDGWVLNLPATVTAEFINKLGSALDIKTEILLAGKEIHDGFTLIPLYFTRCGVKCGYDFNLAYDSRSTSLPDIRDISTIGTTLSDTYISDCVYMIVNFDFSSPLGALSAAGFNTNFKFSYYPRTKGFTFNFALVASF